MPELDTLTIIINQAMNECAAAGCTFGQMKTILGARVQMLFEQLPREARREQWEGFKALMEKQLEMD